MLKIYQRSEKNWPINIPMTYNFNVFRKFVNFSEYICSSFFQNFLTFMRISFAKKIRGYKRKAGSSISRKILECDMESCYRNNENSCFVDF